MTAIISWRVLPVLIGQNCFAIKGDKDLEGTRESTPGYFQKFLRENEKLKRTISKLKEITK